MISKTKIAYIRSLHTKSARHAENVFIVEWRKCISEFLASDFEILEGFFTENFSWTSLFLFPTTIVSGAELARMTTLSSNDAWILLVKMRSNVFKKTDENELILILDSINDPGNLGTIIRIADWYGISQIVVSPDTVDVYNSKVLMATMGSFTRVSICYTDLEEYLVSVTPFVTGGKGDLVSENSEQKSSALSGISFAKEVFKPKIYWAYLNGESTHTKDWWSGWGYLVIGSEAHGISDSLEKYITDKITIPQFGLAESLNAGVATAVILDRIRSE